MKVQTSLSLSKSQFAKKKDQNNKDKIFKHFDFSQPYGKDDVNQEAFLNNLVLMCVKGLMSLSIAKKIGLGDLH
jgi:hypothetical protein